METTDDFSKFYYIEKRAIYLHGVYGPFRTKREADAAFKTAYDNNKKSDDKLLGPFDGHHSYELVQGMGTQVGENSAGTKHIKTYNYEPIRWSE